MPAPRFSDHEVLRHVKLNLLSDVIDGIGASIPALLAAEAQARAAAIAAAFGVGGGISPNPNPPPATAIYGRDLLPLTARDGDYVTFRVAVVVPVVDPLPGDPPLPPVVITPPDGTISGRDGGVLLLRDGTYLRNRIAADPPPVVAVPDPVVVVVPPPVVVVYPTGPHLRLVSNHANFIIETQNGVTATVRVKRPVYINNQLFSAEVFNAGSNYATNIFWGDRLGYLTIQGGNAAVERDILSTDDGAYATTVFRAMADGTFLTLDLTWKVSPLATGTPPAPSAVPNRLTQIYFEDFLPGTGAASLSRAWNVENTGNSTIRLMGYASCMTQTSSDYRDRDKFGYGNGLYEFRVRYFGLNLGNGVGPCPLLWPASDVWPGPEVDVGELFADGTFYSALHWKDASKPVEGNGQNQFTIWPHAHDVTQWFTTAVLIDNLKTVFLVNGVEFARDDFSPQPVDFANGGENHTVGLLSQSTVDSFGTPSGLECDWIRWTPTALLPPMTLVNGKLTIT